MHISEKKMTRRTQKKRKKNYKVKNFSNVARREKRKKTTSSLYIGKIRGHLRHTLRNRFDLQIRKE